MIPGVVRYQQRPPEVDALLVTDATLNAVLAWLAAYGHDAYRTGTALQVIPRPGSDTTGFEVPFGHHLVRAVGPLDRWTAVPPGQLNAEYAALPGQAQPWEQRYGTGRAPRPTPLPTGPPPRLGQPGHGI